ncbi:TPA: LysM peptidoglycan-binding domain-containing protein [Photobacterium damselae]
MDSLMYILKRFYKLIFLIPLFLSDVTSADGSYDGFFLTSGFTVNSQKSDSDLNISPELAVGVFINEYTIDLGYKSNDMNLEIGRELYSDSDNMFSAGIGVNNDIDEHSYLSLSYGRRISDSMILKLGSRYDVSAEFNTFLHLEYRHLNTRKVENTVLPTSTLNQDSSYKRVVAVSMPVKDIDNCNCNCDCSAKADSFVYHTIRNGDTLRDLCSKNNWNIRKLLEYNSFIKNINLIYPGDVLRYPSKER